MKSPEEAPLGIEDLRNLIGELRIMARGLLTSERLHSFTPTALVMTALRRAKLSEQDWTEVRWENRAHFFSALAQAMRHALIDHARRKRARGRQNVVYCAPQDDFFVDLPAQAEDWPDRFVLVEEALAELSRQEPSLAEVIQQFYFLGYSIAEIARFDEVSEKTVDRNLKRARTLLRKRVDELSSRLQSA